MCRCLGLSRSGYYAWRTRPVSERQQRRELLGHAVETAYHQYKRRYGAPRLTVELNEEGIPCSLNHVARLLKEKGLRARNGKGFKYRPRTEARTNVSDNLLARRFNTDRPDRKWVSDITYIRVGRQWLFLAAIMDLFSRKIIGWALADHMRESLIMQALEMAVSHRSPDSNTVLHSDRGVQYRGNEYQAALSQYGLRCSMSRQGNCWDNAVMESFFSRLKVELIYDENYETMESARTGIFEYIEMFYNRQRKHSALGYVSPHAFEQQNAALTVSTSRG